MQGTGCATTSVRPLRGLRLVTLSVGLLAAGSALADFVLSTQPRGPHSEVDKPFEDLAAYLSRVAGITVRYRYVDDWLSYASEMQKGRFDIVFDGPAFVSWRLRSQQHEVLAKVGGGPSRHVVVVKKDNDGIKSMENLIGRKVCARPSPNLATLVLLKEFPNPSRQPYVLPADSYDDAYKKLIDGRCEAAILGTGRFKRLNENGAARVVFTSEPLPPAAITAGPRVTAEQKRKIVEALTSPDAPKHLGTFLKKFTGGQPFEAANPATYLPHHLLLRNEWGFGEP